MLLLNGIPFFLRAVEANTVAAVEKGIVADLFERQAKGDIQFGTAIESLLADLGDIFASFQLFEATASLKNSLGQNGKTVKIGTFNAGAMSESTFSQALKIARKNYFGKSHASFKSTFFDNLHAFGEVDRCKSSEISKRALADDLNASVVGNDATAATAHEGLRRFFNDAVAAAVIYCVFGRHLQRGEIFVRIIS